MIDINYKETHRFNILLIIINEKINYYYYYYIYIDLNFLFLNIFNKKLNFLKSSFVY
jgi:hypothetical protein